MRSRYETAIAIMVKVEEENPNATPEELKKLVRAAYPWGERKYWPYKAWLAAQRDFFEGRERRAAWRGEA